MYELVLNSFGVKLPNNWTRVKRNRLNTVNKSTGEILALLKGPDNDIEELLSLMPK